MIVLILLLQVSRRRDRVTGLDTVQYEIASVNHLKINGAPVTLINVMLQCDLEQTPWCVAPETTRKPVTPKQPQDHKNVVR